MIVKEILAKAAVHLGRRDLFEHLSGIKEDASLNGEAEELLVYYNEVETEIAGEYFPLLHRKICETQTGKIRYDSFAYPFAYVKKLTDDKGKRLGYRSFASYLQTEKGRVCIEYASRPREKAADDFCEVDRGVSEIALVAGILKHYFLTRDLLNESAVWNRTFYEELHAALVARERAGRISCRSWV